MASNLPAACCTTGHKHQGSPKGSIIKVESRWDAYVTQSPPEELFRKGTALLIAPDAMGLAWDNCKLIADQFASNGYLSMVLDIFNGDPVKPGELETIDVMKWITEGSDGKNPHIPEAIDPIVIAAIKTLKEKYGAERIGSVGYCLGAKYTIRHYKSGIDVGYVAHPTMVTEEELSSITGPLAIAAAQIDPIYPETNRHKSETILQQLGFPFYTSLFSSVSHGFAVRGDEGDKETKFASEMVFAQAVAWFNQYL